MFLLLDILAELFFDAVEGLGRDHVRRRGARNKISWYCPSCGKRKMDSSLPS